MNLLQLFKPVSTFVFDVDGVLTDGMVIAMPDGSMLRRMNVKDGYALQLAKKKNYNIYIISGGFSAEVIERLKRLGIEDVLMRIHNKKECLQKIIDEKKLKKEEILFMGDDIPDLELMTMAGVACCPADAVEEIKNLAHYISGRKGGDACVREVIEKTLKIQKNWSDDTSITSK